MHVNKILLEAEKRSLRAMKSELPVKQTICLLLCLFVCGSQLTELDAVAIEP